MGHMRVRLTWRDCKPLDHFCNPIFRLRANERKIVDQQLPTLLDVTCCVHLHTPLHVVECCYVLLRKV